jgi:membrane protein DedA with SNARE-associated domain
MKSFLTMFFASLIVMIGFLAWITVVAVLAYYVAHAMNTNNTILLIMMLFLVCLFVAITTAFISKYYDS